MTEGKFEFVYECHNLTKFLSFEQALSVVYLLHGFAPFGSKTM